MGFEQPIDLRDAIEAAVPMNRFAINHMKPFCDHSDGQRERLEEAHALLGMIAEAFIDSDDGKSPESEAGPTAMRNAIIGRALEGIQTLVALSLYQQELVRKA